MMLAEKLLLLCWDAERGAPASGIAASRLRRGLAAAVLAELALQRRLVGDADALRVADDLPCYAALLGEAASVLARARGAWTAKAAVRRLESGLPRLRARVVDSLVGRDVLQTGGTLLARRYPVRSMQALRAVHAELSACWNAADPPEASLALASIAESAGLLAARATAADLCALRLAVETRRDAAQQAAASDRIALLLAIGEAAGPG